MKRDVLAAVGALAMLLTATPRADPAPLVLSKDGGGHILPNAVSITLRSNPDCDQTQKLIPDLSFLESKSFTLSIDDNGIGFFAGPAQIVGPDGTIVLAGVLHGTVGLTAHRGTTADSCHFPGHFEGMFSGGAPSLPGPAGTTDPNGALLSSFEVNFSADELPTAGPLATYAVHLDGLIPEPSPPAPLVFVAPSQPAYAPGELITALVSNRADVAIQALDMNSFCSIVKLQHLVNNAWIDTYGCPADRAPMPTVIKPGEVLKVGLPETSVPEFRYDPGIYRMVLTYHSLDANGAPVGNSIDAISAEFKVGVPVTVPTLKVAPDKPGYSPTDAITAIIANGAVPVSILDMQSQCTIVQLQREDSSGWVLEDPCLEKRMAVPTVLQAGEVKNVVLGQGLPWTAGTYRLAVTYTPLDSAGSPAGPTQTSMSASFQVGPAPPPDNVYVSSVKPSYGTTEPVTAVIANKSDKVVQVFDMQSDCTIVQLQQQVGADWVMREGCPWARMPLPVLINPGTAMTVMLPPDATSTVKREPGTYRLAIDYQFISADGTVGGFQKAVSPTFTIADGPPPTAQLAVKPDKPAYAATDVITAIVANGATPVSIYDGESLCTIVQLQRADSSGWVLQDPCLLERPTVPTVLQPGEVKAVALTKNVPWVAGTYRLAVTYTPMDASGNPAGPEQTAVSDPFPVGSSVIAPVTLSSDKKAYAGTDPVIATFANALTSDIVTWDHQSFCTVIVMAKQTSAGWVPVAPCPLLSPSMPVVIKAGTSLTQPLPPVATTAPRWDPGTYRLEATYGIQSGAINPNFVVQVMSDPFTIGATITGVIPRSQVLLPKPQ